MRFREKTKQKVEDHCKFTNFSMAPYILKIMINIIKCLLEHYSSSPCTAFLKIRGVKEEWGHSKHT